MAVRLALAAALAAAAVTLATAQPRAPVFPKPAKHPEVIGDGDHFPYLPPLPGTRLVRTRTIDGPLELKPATAEDEAVLAGASYIQKTYDRPNQLTAIVFIAAYRDLLFASGWKLVDVTKLEEIPIQPETVNVAARYLEGGRNLHARLTQEPGGPYTINVADVGAENWAAMLARDCRVPIPSIHFDLDRPSIKLFESEPTLHKLAALLGGRAAPTVEIQGHVDNIGEAASAARQALSEGRAKSVAAWLAANGVPPGRLTARGYGRTRPVADNDSDLGRALNRRIEVARTGCPPSDRPR